MKRSFALASMIVAACLLTVMFLSARGLAQQKPGTVVTGPGSNTGGATGNQSSGRFQVAPYVNGVVVMDTTTGHCWSKNLTVANAQWQDRGAPSGDRN